MTQAEALSILKTGAHVFLTGSPGSGKTHTVNAYVSWLRSFGIEPAITASTGIAATHIRGMTIHSWSGIGVRTELNAQDLDAIVSKEHVVRRIGKTSVLIIDEVSMLSGDTLDMVDRVLREARHSNEPFGGIRVVLVGDFFQLPPISKGKEATFAFESEAWKSLNPVICYLTEQFRQEDGRFLDVLSNMRSGTCEPGDISCLMEREMEEADTDIPRLYTHNADVDRINDEKLAALSGDAKRYTLQGEGAPPLIEGLKRGCLSPEKLVLKQGAVVMFTKNNPVGSYMNGTLGTVIGFERGSNLPIVETHDGVEIIVQPTDWAIEEGGKIRAKITQLPLRLAWAITIHKSQGMSMDAAAIDLSRAFEYGQGYVALSRVRSLQGLHLLGWSEQALMMHPKVQEVDVEFQALSEEAKEAFARIDETGEREKLEKNFVIASGGSYDYQGKPEKVVKLTTYEETLVLLGEGKSVKEIADARSLTFGTIVAHLETLAQSGKLAKLEIRRALPEKLLASLPDIHAMYEKLGTDRLAPVHGRLKGRYTYEELRLAKLLLPE